ncbi:hydrogen gas-evolving membrane-bound hydrogenase subunit E [Candidatus Oleimmundimicrobium sp.]|uniref:hydrogen gas-evolving membrane-bound hydrogenase subunit E n=1 Tax=Candidatus Oleimmundimicrobium sp. TaxID=3060597 RepID=UPI00271B459F|nr:hydrogen gas-evolving membrane-bound hydrogenase subunit E [Candidatus Oleimmundimicrobium sp.]MDO8885884.1 MnhB domain-containing protein [Candidatus Oleimmundimicrobium sp.]
MKKGLAIFALLLLWVLLISTVVVLPPMGSPENPTYTHIVPRYLEKGVEEGGAHNIITGIILNYRGYDTMGEVTVIFTALMAVLAVLGRENFLLHTSKAEMSTVEKSIIVKSVARFLTPFIVLFALYIIFHGAESPGGGFQGGAILGASIIIITLTLGLAFVTKKLSLKYRVLFESAGPLGFFIIGMVGILCGQNFLTYLLPCVALAYQDLVRHLLLIIVEIGIGVGGGAIIASIFFAMEKVEKE